MKQPLAVQEGRAADGQSYFYGALLGRAQDAALPFALRGFDRDNGGEFLNHHLLACPHERQKPVAFTRSRPYHSHDNAHVEQENWMWPRQPPGYDRLERAELVAPITALYAEAWGPLMNFFLPGLKLQQKWRENSRWKKRYEPARTAYQRLMEPGVPGRPRCAPAIERSLRESGPLCVESGIGATVETDPGGGGNRARPCGEERGGIDRESKLSNKHESLSQPHRPTHNFSVSFIHAATGRL